MHTGGARKRDNNLSKVSGRGQGSNAGKQAQQKNQFLNEFGIGLKHISSTAIVLAQGNFSPRSLPSYCMKEFIAYLIKNLVELPADVQVEVIDKEQGVLVEVRVSSQDVARVVGKQGRTINALRTIAMIVGARFGRKVRLELIN